MSRRTRHRYLCSMPIRLQSRRSIGESTDGNPSIRAISAPTGPKGGTICTDTFCADMPQDNVAEEGAVEPIRKL